MKLILPFIHLFILCLSCNPQNDSALLVSARTKLIEGSNVSSILTSEKYLSIHHLSAFRELIEKNAGTGSLSISTPAEPGKKIKVLVTIQDETGTAIPNAMIYLYQTDAKGWYAANSPHVGGNEGDMRHARLFGYVRTDANGKFELETVKPSGYPQSDLPAHIHIHLWAAGYHSAVTELLFDDDERLVGEIRAQSIRNKFLIAKPEAVSGSFEQQFSYIIPLRRK